jgi:phosphate-selective porin OprO/OprP
MFSRSIFDGLLVLLAVFFLVWVCGDNVHASSQSSTDFDLDYNEFLEELKERNPLRSHIYWDWHDGLHYESPKKELFLRVGGRVYVDGGYVFADDNLQMAFPDLKGPDIILRSLLLTLDGTLHDVWDLKMSMDFSDLREIKDNWFGRRKIPFLGHARIGYLKESFSLENLTGHNDVTFMERSLPTNVLSPGRDLGLMFENSILEKRMTWALGGFWVVGSTDQAFDDAKDRIDDSQGVAITARITGLPWYAHEGKSLLHLGFSYTHQFRDDQSSNSQARFGWYPESLLVDEYLVDTGKFFSGGGDAFGTEAAFVSGPLSFQGEFLQVFNDANSVGDPHFWGLYAYVSYFLTGEHRPYDTSKGIFGRVKPKSDFNPFEGRWGACEVAFRFSYLDLNDGSIKGGKETNLTAGLNWYFNPNSRLMFNFIRARVRDRDIPPGVDDGLANILQARLEIAF